MQREILFKAIRIGKVQWVEGYYYKSETYTKHYIICEHSKSCNGMAQHTVEVAPETVCQYTTFKDRTGRNIFFSDKVEYKGRIYTIKLVKGTMYGISQNSGELDYPLKTFASGCKVIGNIHDKKEGENE